jgi:hypothetical protein
MKIALESSFPEGAAPLLMKPGVRVVRLEGRGWSDGRLVEQAATSGCHAIVFIGRQALGRPDAVATARQLGITLAVTATQNPIDAVDYVRENLGRLAAVLNLESVVSLNSHSLVRGSELDTVG